MAYKEAKQAELAFDAAVMSMRSGRRAEAAEICWEVVKRLPRHADAWAMRARIEAEEGRHANAMLHHAMALQADRNRHDLWCNRGIDAMGARMYQESEESFIKSLALQDSYEGHYGYGNLLSSMMRVDEAVEQYKLALAIDSKTNPQIHSNLGIAMIAQGNWQQGFNAYRHRFNASGFPPRPRFNFENWRGEPIAGKTIMLYAEQGFGDEIMAIRFAKAVKDRGARVILAVRPLMYRLARSFKHDDAICLLYDVLPWTPDYMCALLDVPAFTDMTPDIVPLKVGYLTAETRGFDLGFESGLNVGVCWASGKRPSQPNVAETARQKSLTFPQLVAPLAQSGVNLVSLQQSHDDERAMRECNVKNPMGSVQDFADTAWIISQLDLVISVDTAVAHLAGALGKPVWNLVRFDALWPWQQETEKTCWYDSMKLYRQTQAYDWNEPLARIKADLARLVEDNAQNKSDGTLSQESAAA
jgi:tetratricopeptide (TPR) repeat protein